MNSGFWKGFEKRAGIAGGVGHALGAAKGVLTRGARGISQAGRATQSEFRQGAAAGLKQTDPAMSRAIRMKTNPTKAPAPAAAPGGVGSHVKSLVGAGTAIAAGGAAGAYLASRGNREPAQG